VALTRTRRVCGQAPVRALAPGHGVEHEAAQREVMFKHGLAPNPCDYGHDPVERSLPLTFLCRFVWRLMGFADWIKRYGGMKLGLSHC
jgi:hypothetical protein